MTCGRKLTSKQIEEIIYLLQTTNITNHENSLKYNVSDTTIQNINIGKRYKKKILNIRYANKPVSTIPFVGEYNYY